MTQNDMEPPVCELCGEEHATVQLHDVGACDDCAEKELRAALKDAMGHVCANVSRRSNGYLTVCLAPHGIEHDHD